MDKWQAGAVVELLPDRRWATVGAAGMKDGKGDARWVNIGGPKDWWPVEGIVRSATPLLPAPSFTSWAECWDALVAAFGTVSPHEIVIRLDEGSSRIFIVQGPLSFDTGIIQPNDIHPGAAIPEVYDPAVLLTAHNRLSVLQQYVTAAAASIAAQEAR